MAATAPASTRRSARSCAGRSRSGYEVVGIRHGFRGLAEGDDRPARSAGRRRDPAPRRDDPRLVELRLLPRGGRRRVAARDDARALELEGVVAIGGEGTLAIAHRLHAEHGFPVVGVPKTIDNDIAGTDVTIGFDTAVHVCTEAIDRLHSTAESHNRVMVVEVMGRNTGWIAAASGIAGGADVILVPEVPDADRGRLPITSGSATRTGEDFSIVVVAEGYALTRRSGEQDAPVVQELDEYGYARLGGIGRVVADEIARLTGFETRVTVLGHVQRGGTPTARDRVLATRLGLQAAELAAAGTLGPHGGGARQRDRRRPARGGDASAAAGARRRGSRPGASSPDAAERR